MGINFLIVINSIVIAYVEHFIKQWIVDFLFFQLDFFFLLVTLVTEIQ